MAVLSGQYNDYIKILLNTWHDVNGIQTTRQPDILGSGTGGFIPTSVITPTTPANEINAGSRPINTNVWSRQSVDEVNPLLEPIRTNINSNLSTPNKFYFELAKAGNKTRNRRDQPRPTRQSATSTAQFSQFQPLSPTFLNQGVNYELVLSCYYNDYGLGRHSSKPEALNNAIDFMLFMSQIDMAGSYRFYYEHNTLVNFQDSAGNAITTPEYWYLEGLHTNITNHDSIVERQFNKHVMPRLNSYYVNYKTSNGDALSSRVLQEWWNEEKHLFAERFVIICKEFEKSFNSGNLPTIDSSVGLATSAFLPIVKKTVDAIGPDDYAKSDSKVNAVYLISLLADYPLSTTAYDQIFELFGYSAWAAKKIREGEKSLDQSGTGVFSDDTVAELEGQTQGADLPRDALLAAVTGVSGEATKDDLLNFRQCALLTDLIDPTSGRTNDHVTSYANDNYYNSPLHIQYDDPINFYNAGNTDFNSEKRAANRIYMINTDYDYLKFINHCHIDKGEMKDVFESSNKSPDGFISALFWVYEDEDGNIREKEITKDSNSAMAKQLLKVRDLRLALQIAQTDPAAVALGKINKIFDGNPDIERITSIQVAKLQKDLDTAEKELVLSDLTKESYYTLKNTKVKFDGTNISTARNDVEVTLTWDLGAARSLQSEILKLDPTKDKPPAGGRVLRLIDLVTLPVNNTPSVKSSPSQWMTNQYSPNYSRLRLKFGPSSESKSIMMIDLSTIDHEITRDSETGKTTFTINYRGYFESVMNQPFNDALANDSIIESRIQRQENAIKKLKSNNCDSNLVREVLRMEQDIFDRESRKISFSSLIDRLDSRGLIHYYKLDNAKLLASSVGNSFYATENIVTDIQASLARTAGDGRQPFSSGANFKTLEQKIQENREKDEKISIADIVESENLTDLRERFFFLGDLMWVALDCLYKENSAELRKHVSNLNIRTILCPIEVPALDDPEKSIKINIASIPIDLEFFMRWFQQNVIDKGLRFYPVGTFIRDLIEKLVNRLLYDICFANLLPDEQPPLLRCGFLSTTDEDFLSRTGVSFTVPPTSVSGQCYVYPDTQAPDGEILLKKQFPKVVSNQTDYTSNIVNSKNYMVIYSQNLSFRRGQRLADGKFLRENDYVPSIFYGARNTDNNYINDVSFSKTTSQNLREARFFNNSFGGLALLSNVYDLSFKFFRRKANTFFYPGSVINFYLLDFDEKEYSSDSLPWDQESWGDDDPHTARTTANVLGFGGYYIIKDVIYDLGETAGEFSISISTKFLGDDAKKDSRSNEDFRNVKQPKECADAFNLMSGRANELYEAGDAEYGIVFGDPDLKSKLSDSDHLINESNTVKVPESAGGSSATADITSQLFFNFVDEVIEKYTSDILSDFDNKINSQNLTSGGKIIQPKTQYTISVAPDGTITNPDNTSGLALTLAENLSKSFTTNNDYVYTHGDLGGYFNITTKASKIKRLIVTMKNNKEFIIIFESYSR